MRYQVVVTREGENWLADVPAVEGTHTYSRTLPKLEAEVREAIALALDLPEGGEAALELDFELHTGRPAWDKAFSELRQGRRQVEKAKQLLENRTQALARESRGELSVRDAGWLLGVSAQRVSQLTSSS